MPDLTAPGHTLVTPPTTVTATALITHATPRKDTHAIVYFGMTMPHKVYRCRHCYDDFIESPEGAVAIEAGVCMEFASGAYLACRNPHYSVAYCSMCATRVERCRVCGCTVECACPGGCEWADETEEVKEVKGGPICTACIFSANCSDGSPDKAEP